MCDTSHPSASSAVQELMSVARAAVFNSATEIQMTCKCCKTPSYEKEHHDKESQASFTTIHFYPVNRNLAVGPDRQLPLPEPGSTGGLFLLKGISFSPLR